MGAGRGHRISWASGAWVSGEGSELFFQEGASDQVYNAKPVENDDATYTVEVEWGRRGAGLSKGSKAEKAGQLD